MQAQTPANATAPKPAWRQLKFVRVIVEGRRSAQQLGARAAAASDRGLLGGRGFLAGRGLVTLLGGQLAGFDRRGWRLGVALALFHGFLESADGLAEIRANGAQLLRAENHEDDQQDDQQMLGGE